MFLSLSLTYIDDNDARNGPDNDSIRDSNL